MGQPASYKKLAVEERKPKRRMRKEARRASKRKKVEIHPDPLGFLEGHERFGEL